MRRPDLIGILAALMLISTLYAVPGALAVSWTSFGTAEFSGITWDKPLDVDVLDYTLTISNKPTMTVGSHTYQVVSIQSVYLLGATADGRFTATNGAGNTLWNWDSKTSGGGQVSGWTGQGSNRLYAGDSTTFHFSSFDPEEKPVVVGYHVVYKDGNDTITGWWKQNLITTQAAVPEPAPILCMGVAIVGLLAHVRRRGARI